MLPRKPVADMLNVTPLRNVFLQDSPAKGLPAMHNELGP